jgi:hypothetical protein
MAKQERCLSKVNDTSKNFFIWASGHITWTVYDVDVIHSCDAFYSGDCKWKLYFYPNEGLYLCLISSKLDGEEVEFKCECSLNNSSKCTKFKGKLEKNYGYLIDPDNIYESGVTFNVKVSHLVKDSFLEVSSPEIKIARDLALMFNKQILCDVTLFSADKVFITKAHKNILAIRSSTFAIMIENLDNLNEIILLDSDVSVILAMIRFMYSGYVRILGTNFCVELLRAAEKYCMDDLITVCVNYLITQIDSSNAQDLLLLANEYSYETLERNVIDYIEENPELFRTKKQYQKIKTHNPDLLVELLRKSGTYKKKIKA